jgi:tetratricopeptide (TPR) repeat protein
VRRLFLLLVMLCFAVPANAEWWEARTDHFIIYSKSSAKDAKDFAERLERYDQSLRSLQVIKPDPRLSDARRVKIYRAGNIVDISVLAGDAESGIAGFYIPRLEPVAFVPAREQVQLRSELDPETVLKHEYAHHFMFRHFPGTYPSWYVEGIAELYSTIEFQPDGSFLLGKVPQARGDVLVGKYRHALNYSIRRMLMSGSKPNFEDFYGRYTYGWLFTDYTAFEPSRKGQILTYLRLLDEGVDANQAATRAFGDLDKLESDVGRYLNAGKFPVRAVRFANYKAPVAEMRQLGPDEEAIMPVVMRSKVGVSPRTAKGVAGDARSVAARYPNSFPVQLELAEAELDAENFDGADRAADAAIALKPDSAEALYFKGQIAIARGKTDPKQYASAREWFAKAHDADPDHPGPLMGNYLSYSKAGVAAPETAVIGLENAYRLAPYDGELRIILAREELAEKRLDVAKMLLVPLALSPHESKQAKALSDVVDQIDANKGAEALTKIDAWIAKAEQEKKKKGD